MKLEVIKIVLDLSKPRPEGSCPCEDCFAIREAKND